MLTLAAGDTIRGHASLAATVTVTISGMELASGTEVYKVLVQVQPGTSVATLYTVPASTIAMVKSIHVVNTDTVTARSFSLRVNGSADANRIIPTLQLPAGGFAVYVADGWNVYDANGLLLVSQSTGAPSGPAGGELAGTYPNPTVVATHSGSAHHDAVTIGADAEHSLAGQALSGVDAAAAQKGHVQLAGDLTGTAASPAVANDAITDAKLRNSAATSVIGRSAGTSGDPADIAASADSQFLSRQGGALAFGAIAAADLPAHGAGQHTDITRTFPLGIPMGTADGATVGNGGTLPNSIRRSRMTDGAVQGHFWSFFMPPDAKTASPLSVRIAWSPAATDATPHTVRWLFSALVIAAGVNTTGAGSSTSLTGVSQANTANLMVFEATTQVLASTSAGDFVKLTVERVGNDANDTYVGDVDLLGVELSYTATG